MGGARNYQFATIFYHVQSHTAEAVLSAGLAMTLSLFINHKGGIMLVSATCTQFLNHCRSAMSLSEHTHRAYGSDLKDAGKYFGSKKRIKAVTKEDLRQYIRHLREQRKFKETSIKRRVACLKLLFRWAIRESIITANPFDTLNERIRLPKRLPRALDRSHVRLLRKAITPTARSESFDALCRKTAIQLLLDTGIRVGELANASTLTETDPFLLKGMDPGSAQ